MIAKAFDDIQKPDIDALVADKVCEVREIEYKRELPPTTDKAKKEFLADASSFANTTGGDLIFGVDAPDGIPIAAAGLADANADQIVRQLENMLRDSLAPRLLGVRTKAILDFPKGPVVLMRIPRSWAAPHMVTYQGSSRFFVRNSAGKHQMDVTEIRSAFLLSEGVADRVRRFRERRIATILAEETPVPLTTRTLLVIHLIPLSDHPLNMQNVGPASGIQPIGGFSRHYRHNIDGFMACSDLNPKCDGYCQLFRNGAIEAVNCDYLIAPKLPLDGIEIEIHKMLSQYVTTLDALGVAFPLAFAVSMLGVKGKTTAQSRLFAIRGAIPTYDRDQIHLPDVLIEGPKVDLQQAIKPVFDAMWQGMGIPRSPAYEKGGQWYR